MDTDPAFRDWPKARMYALDTSEHPTNIFAPGIHPVGFRYWETTDYRDAWPDGDCSREKSKFWRTGLLAQVQRKNLNDFALEPEKRVTVPYSSADSFQNRVEETIDHQSAAFESVVESFVQLGALSIEDSSELHLKCRVQIEDDRPWPRAELPPVEGKWCTSAPAKRDELPE